jgi:outer membrane protein assembly factor BamD
MTRLFPRAVRRSGVALVTAVVLVAGACGPKRDVLPPGTVGADQFLYEHGTAALKAKKWVDATDYFTKLIDGYPQSQYRADAKLGMGDVYLAQGSTESLVMAQNEYREFLTFYPTSPRADYAQYQLGMTHFKGMRAPERDQTETKDAIKEFEFFFQRFPNSSLRPQAEARLREAKDRLDQADFGVGLHYYRTRWYPGAIARFKELLKADPNFTNRDAVYFYLAESLLKTANTAEALPWYERLVSEFQSSQHLDEARKRISELKLATRQQS